MVIVGQTASGKSALALELARKFGGEILCADSRTVYKGMDIGTAKPSKEDQRIVPHHLLDILEPDQVITAAQFKQKAQQTIKEIGDRGNVAFMVGGTGLYLDSVLFDFQFRPKPDPELRKKLLTKSVQELQEILSVKGLPYPENSLNPRHLIRQIESEGYPVKKGDLRSNTIILGTAPLDREDLEQRLVARLDRMFRQGLEAEVKTLAKKYGWECPGLQTIGYQEFRPYFRGESDISEVKVAIIQNSLHYAKRQKTWFKRNKDVHWICKKEESVDLITSILNKNYIALKPSLLQ